MKKFNKNSLLFVFVIAFIVFGLFGGFFEKLRISAVDMLVGLKHGNIESVADFKKSVDKITSEELRYHNAMMDVNSLKENLLGTRVIEKEDETIVKSDSGSLTAPVKKLDKNDMRYAINAIDRLKTVSENNGAKFLYCAAPQKEYYEQAPENIENHFKENYGLFLSELKGSNIPFVDFTPTVNDIGTNAQTFYNTDHHWTTRAGFAANSALVKELNARYGFEYKKDAIDISHYNIKNYPNWFLGSKGKKTGAFFTWSHADDFELITPDFKTNLTEEQPFKNETRTGAFEDSVLYKEFLKKDYYNISTYYTYCGSESRLQIMKNDLETNGKKILLIRDSYACVVAPFLALQTSELHICDMRDYKMHVGNKLNTEEYIKEIKPDYVIVLYSGISAAEDSNNKFNFF